MPAKKKHKKQAGAKNAISSRLKTALKIGDQVMVIAGGSGEKRPNKGKIGKILRFAGSKSERVVVEGVNLMTKHKRQTTMQDKAEKILVESAIHISNVMFYAEKIKAPVRLKFDFLEDGKKVRGFVDPKSKKFTQV